MVEEKHFPFHYLDRNLSVTPFFLHTDSLKTQGYSPYSQKAITDIFYGLEGVNDEVFEVVEQPANDSLNKQKDINSQGDVYPQ